MLLSRQQQNYCFGVVCLDGVNVGVACVDGLVRKRLGIVVDFLLVRKQVVYLVESINKFVNLSLCRKRCCWWAGTVNNKER